LQGFPQRLSFSRFTGTFHDLDIESVPFAPIYDDSHFTTSKYLDKSPAPQRSSANGKNGQLSVQVQQTGNATVAVYAAKEDERERVLAWAKKNRLPLFVQ